MKFVILVVALIGNNPTGDVKSFQLISKQTYATVEECRDAYTQDQAKYARALKQAYREGGIEVTNMSIKCHDLGKKFRAKESS
jgi:hypothetical protein